MTGPDALEERQDHEGRRQPGEEDEARLLRREHQAGRDAGGDGPERGPLPRVPPSGADERREEEDEQGLLDVETAVIGQRRRNGGQRRGREGRLPGQPAGKEQEDEEESRAEEGRDEPEDPLVETGQRRLAGRPGRGQGQVIEAGAVMVVRVEAVVAALEEVAELDRLVGLVGMHGPEVQADEPEGEGADDGAEKESPEGLLRHLAGRP